MSLSLFTKAIYIQFFFRQLHRRRGSDGPHGCEKGTAQQTAFWEVLPWAFAGDFLGGQKS